MKGKCIFCYSEVIIVRHPRYNPNQMLLIRPEAREGILILIIMMVIFILHATGIPVPAQAQDTSRCDICRKNISGKFWTHQGKVICDRCYQTAPRCFLCNLPDGRLADIDGRKICPGCLSRLPTCHHCGSRMARYWSKQDSSGHQQDYCSRCQAGAPAGCHLCDKAFTSRYWIIKSNLTNETRYICDECNNLRKTLGSCFLCGMPVRAGVKPLSDDRVMCERCRETAIISRVRYQEVYREVMDCITDKMGLFYRQKYPFEVVSRRELAHVKSIFDKEGQSSGDKMGYFRSIRRTVTYSGTPDTDMTLDGKVYIISHLPRDVAVWVMAHEYGHAWYYENVHARKSIHVVEGFAEWVAYHVLMNTGRQKLADKVRSRTDAYGEGVRMLLDIEKKRGFQGVIEFIKK